MNEFFHHVFSPQNLLATLILCFCLVYWLIVIVGAIDVDFFDVDIELDTDVDGANTGESGIAWLNKVLLFFNLGRVPFMVWLTIVALPLWVGSIIVSFLVKNESFLISLLYFIPLLIGALILAKPLTWPFVKMFDALEKSDSKKDLIGRVGRVIIAGTGQKRGQIEISYDGSVITIYVKPANDEIVLQKNMEVLVIDKVGDHYLVEPYL